MWHRVRIPLDAVFLYIARFDAYNMNRAIPLENAKYRKIYAVLNTASEFLRMRCFYTLLDLTFTFNFL